MELDPEDMRFVNSIHEATRLGQRVSPMTDDADSRAKRLVDMGLIRWDEEQITFLALGRLRTVRD